MNINTGQYVFELTESVGGVSERISMMYGDSVENAIVDYPISINFPSIVRRFVKRNINFSCDQHTPFKPLPYSQAYPLLEWGMNWCIAAFDFTHLIIHSAVLVKNGNAILFPAVPGAGKSTLTTYMGLGGWKVYSDEMAVIDLKTLKVKPMFRPACIKNHSIELVKNWFPEAIVTQPCHDTAKGTVAHVKVSSWSDFIDYEPADIAAIVFPKYTENLDLDIYRLSQVQGFKALTEQAFNYHVLGLDGFLTISNLIEKVKLFEVHYSNLDFLDDFLIEEALR